MYKNYIFGCKRIVKEGFLDWLVIYYYIFSARFDFFFCARIIEDVGRGFFKEVFGGDWDLGDRRG